MKTMLKLFFPIVCLTVFSIANAQSVNPQVQLETSMGTILLELNAQAAPKTTANFLAYVKNGFYDNTIFHRVIPGFMVQGGGFTPEMKQKITQAPIDNEADNGLKNTAGSIAMARTNDPHSATAQFFINVVDNAFLDHKAKNPRGWGYCVFGRVVKGMDVMRAIEKVPTTTRDGHRDVPVAPVVIQKATIAQLPTPKAGTEKK
ncbi:MAG: peptidyl-prolyl cis-trans isomerase [Desulfobacteraceae bacterium]|nr:MAG: peptidyl-prolyl cis-trans isomerase [Desulfobacteraceae bacterium]